MKELTAQQQRMIAEALRSGTAQQWKHTQGHQYFIEELSSDTPEGLRIAKCIKLATLLWHSAVNSTLVINAPCMVMTIGVSRREGDEVFLYIDKEYNYWHLEYLVSQLAVLFITYPTIVAVWMNAATDEPQDGE